MRSNYLLVTILLVLPEDRLCLVVLTQYFSNITQLYNITSFVFEETFSESQYFVWQYSRNLLGSSVDAEQEVHPVWYSMMCNGKVKLDIFRDHIFYTHRLTMRGHKIFHASPMDSG